MADKIPDYGRYVALDPQATLPAGVEFGQQGGAYSPYAFGIKPYSGFSVTGANAPALGEDGTYNGAKGRWLYQGPAQALRNGGDSSAEASPSLGTWVFEATDQPSQAAPQQQPPSQAQPKDTRDIYGSWDDYIGKARDEAAGMNRMPFVFSDYSLIGLDKPSAMNQFYPAAWQTEGVQKTIGPNGQNIGPELQRQLGNAQAIDTTQGSWPSLIEMLMKGGLDATKQQALLDLAKPKTLDTGFTGPGMMGMLSR